MAEVENPTIPVATPDRTPTEPNILDQVRELINQTPDLPPEESSIYETDVRILEPSMIKIGKELSPEFEEGRYGLIIGDDTSGRLPALAVKGVADFVSDASHKEHPKLVFLQAGHDVSSEDVVKQFNERVVSQKDKLSGRRILVVTEYIDAAQVMNRLNELMTNNHLGFDVVTFGDSGDYTKRKLKFNDDVRIFRGIPREFQYTGPLFKKAGLSGLATAYVNRPVQVLRRENLLEPDYLQVPAARRDVKKLVNRTVRAVYNDPSPK